MSESKLRELSMDFSVDIGVLFMFLTFPQGLIYTFTTSLTKKQIPNWVSAFCDLSRQESKNL